VGQRLRNARRGDRRGQDFRRVHCAAPASYAYLRRVRRPPVKTEGMADSLTTTTGKSDIYTFIFNFNQKGLMAGIGLQGSKVIKIGK
jgi:hypothetical protein